MKAPEFEAQMVGAVLAAKEPFALLKASGLHPETFSDTMCRTTWAIALDLARDAKRTDAFAVWSAGLLTKAFRDDDLGVLQSLQARPPIPTETFIQVAQAVRRHAHARVLGQQLGELSKELYAGVDPARVQPRFEAIAENYRRLFVAVGRRGSDVIAQHFNEFDQRRKDGRAEWLTTGFPKLDKVIGGSPPKLQVLLGAPGSLKTGIAVSMLEAQCAAGLKPLVFVFEDGTSAFAKRPLARELKMLVRDVFAKDFPDGERAAEVGQQLSSAMHEAWFVTREQARTPEDVLRISRQMIAQQGITNVWVDNARAVKCEPRAKWQTRRDRISEMYELFAEFADSMHTPLTLLAHTTRKYEERTHGRGPPVMSDIGETGDAEKDVRLLLALWWKWGRLRMTIGKHTEGESGQTVEFERLADAGLVSPDSGELVDLEAEKGKERKSAAERGDEEAVAKQLRRKELKTKVLGDLEAAKAKETAAAKATEPAPQLELLPGGKDQEKKP